MSRFSGRQLTIIIVSICVGAMIAPVSVSYAVDQLVNIADPKSGNIAHVGHDGTLNVESRAGVPQRAFNVYRVIDSGYSLLATSHPTDRLAITEMTFSQVQLNNGSSMYLDAYIHSGANPTTCPASPATGTAWSHVRLRDLRVPGSAQGVAQLTFNGPPMLLPDNLGDTTCLYAHNYYANVTVAFGMTAYKYSP